LHRHEIGSLSYFHLHFSRLPSIIGERRRRLSPEYSRCGSDALQEHWDVTLNLYVFKPKDWKATDKRPAVVFFVGGGWNHGSPQHFVPQCKTLCRRGMVTIAADYRVASRNRTKGKDCVDDARDAMRWVRSHAGELGINPDQIAAGGGSAGGHIAACLGTIKPEKEKVSSMANAMLLFNPVCVLAPIDDFDAWPTGFSSMKRRMGVDDVTELSPAHHVDKSSAPCVIFHGKSDTSVPYATAEKFAEKMKAAGARCELVGYEQAGHGFYNFGRDHHRTSAEMDAFLVSLGWLKAVRSEGHDQVTHRR
jgi:acetyl esterase/lipase